MIESLGRELEQFDFEFLLRQALDRVPPDIDKREGSIIFDALAPACYLLAEKYMRLRYFYQDVFVQSATDRFLDLRVAEQNLTRRLATKAISLGYFTNSDGKPFGGNLAGMQFASIGAENSIRFTVTESHDLSGHWRLECNEVGTIGNSYIGDLLPIDHVNGLGTAKLIASTTPGQDIETDASLRARYFEAIDSRAFGGNVTQYRQEVMGIQGVGAVQIYPVWDGGGTVKVVVLGASFDPASTDFISQIQSYLDPAPNSGEGLGLAPVGHRVTVDTATVRTINISVGMNLVPGITANQMTAPIRQVLEDYFLSLRRNWDRADDLGRHSLTAFRSQIMATLLSINEITNVSVVILNNIDNDVQLTQTGQLQEIPILGEVTVNVN